MTKREPKSLVSVLPLPQLFPLRPFYLVFQFSVVMLGHHPELKSLI